MRAQLVHLSGPKRGQTRTYKDTNLLVGTDPDARVREAIDLIFRTFRETWSIRQAYLWFHHEGIERPAPSGHTS